MLGTSKLSAFVPSTDVAAARDFYEKTLGLQFLHDDGYALVFDANGTRLRVQRVEKVAPHPFTVLGWQVEDIKHAVQTLGQRGVSFERYDFLEQDELGIWSPGDGAQVAWFKDPDGNLLSLDQQSS